MVLQNRANLAIITSDVKKKLFKFRVTWRYYNNIHGIKSTKLAHIWVGESINYVDKYRGGGVTQPHVNDTTYAYVVNLSTKGVTNHQNPVNVVYRCSLYPFPP